MKFLTTLLSLLLISCGQREMPIEEQSFLCLETLREPNCVDETLYSYPIEEKLGYKATLLVFHTGWCGSCYAELRMLPTWKAEFGENLQIITVLMEDVYGSSEDKFLLKAACEEAATYGIGIHYDVVDNPVLFYELGGWGYPYNVLIDSNCVVHYTMAGLHEDILRANIEDLMF